MAQADVAFRHILLVDAHLVTRQWCAMVLRPLAQLHVHPCATAAEARKWMETCGAPDLLIIGLAFPGESGLQLIAALRAGADWERSLPIMVMATDEGQEELLAIKPFKVLGVFARPMDPTIFLAAVTSELAWPSHNPRLESVRCRFGGDEAFYELFLAGCKEHFPADVKAISDAFVSGDLAVVKRVVHSLKGVLALLREDVASELARRVECAATAGDASEATSVWAVLRAWLTWFVEASPGKASQSSAPSLCIPRHRE